MRWWLWLLTGYFAANAIITILAAKTLEKKYWLVVYLSPLFGLIMLAGGLINWAIDKISLCKLRRKWGKKSG